MKKILLSLSQWHYDRLKQFASDNGIGIIPAIRMIINQYLKDKNY